MTQTPHGDECVAFNATSPIVPIIINQARGSWQREVAANLIRNGYVIGYLATGSKLRGKAKSYNTGYERSLSHLMERTRIAVHQSSPYRLLDGPVGPKGAFGYYLVD
jgi:hypothetical protein